MAGVKDFADSRTAVLSGYGNIKRMAREESTAALDRNGIRFLAGVELGLGLHSTALDLYDVTNLDSLTS